MKSVQDCLHMLGTLKPVMPVLPEAAALEVAELLLKLFQLQQQLLSCHAADCLSALASGAANTGNVSGSKLQLLIKARSPFFHTDYLPMDTHGMARDRWWHALSHLPSQSLPALQTLARKGKFHTSI